MAESEEIWRDKSRICGLYLRENDGCQDRVRWWSGRGVDQVCGLNKGNSSSDDAW